MTEDHIIQRIKNIVHLAQSIYANVKYGFPSKGMRIFGVTGTDGKTTTTLLMYHVLKEAGFNVGYISTIGAKIGDKDIDTGLHVTTPDPWMVPKYIKMMKDKNVDYVVLEATSNGLQQNRLWGVEFFGGIITNIKSDHLDYHGNWKNYADSKLKLVKQIRPGGKFIINKEDGKSYDYIRKSFKSDNQDLNIFVLHKELVNDLNFTLEGIDFKYKNTDFHANLIGKFNLENILNVILLLDGIVELSEMSKAIKSFKPPKGRMEVVNNNPFTVIIDFAHTPSSLEFALISINDLRKADQKLIVVFGCAGKRDKARRKMGEVAARLADIVILTAEDPRDEKLFDINNQIYQYSKNAGGVIIKRFANTKEYKNTDVAEIKKDLLELLGSGKKPIIAFDADDTTSRTDAIHLAINLASNSDIVYTTGKAHEQSLAFGDDENEMEWSEHKEVKKALSKLTKI